MHAPVLERERERVVYMENGGGVKIFGEVGPSTQVTSLNDTLLNTEVTAAD